MNHPFFFLSIAAVAPFYCIFFLSLIRDIIRSYYAGGSDKTPKKPGASSNKNNMTFTSIFLAHWVTGERSPAPFTLIMNPLAGQSAN
jgi:hypothetical protein